MTNRRAIPPRLRFNLLQRFNFRCHYCGITSKEAKLVVDHLIPFSLGGLCNQTNYVVACEPCNAGKADLIPSRIPELPPIPVEGLSAPIPQALPTDILYKQEEALASKMLIYIADRFG